MEFLRRWRQKCILKKFLIPLEDWESTLKGLPMLAGLVNAEQESLRELATLFLHEKSLEATGGFVLTERMKLSVAVQAVFPLMCLGPDWSADWKSAVIYPGEFLTRQEWLDDDGVVHYRREILGGEVWAQGPVVLSWADVEASGQCSV